MNGMPRTVRSAHGFVTCNKGTVAMLFGLSLVPIVIATGISLDYARALTARQQLQNAVDAAAIAGARIPATANQNRADAASAAFMANIAQTSLGNIQPNINASNKEVVVEATYSQPTTFLSVAGVDSIDLKVTTRARSQIENGGVVCLLALNPTTSDGLHLQGINKQTAENCWAWVNSTHATSINAVGASMGKAQGYCTAGGVLGADHFNPAPYKGCDPMEDPFYSTFSSYSPAAAACKETNLKLSNGTYTLTPGRYCGGIELKPQAKVTFQPGLYVIDNGKFQIQAQASASGSGVTFYFTGNNAELEVRGGGNVDFKAPANGDLAGFVLVQNQYTTPSGKEAVVQGGGNIKIEGIVYMPTWRVNVSGNSEINQASKYLAMIADSFYMEGNGKLYVKSDAAGAGLPHLMPKIPTGPLLLD
jgi:Flp pilus assembly protein TadG